MGDEKQNNDKLTTQSEKKAIIERELEQNE
jgi:hypothetical protein